MQLQKTSEGCKMLVDPLMVSGHFPLTVDHLTCPNFEQITREIVQN